MRGWTGAWFFWTGNRRSTSGKDFLLAIFCSTHCSISSISLVKKRKRGRKDNTTPHDGIKLGKKSKIVSLQNYKFSGRWCRCYDVSSDLGQIYPEADEIAILRNAKIVGLSPKIELKFGRFSWFIHHCIRLSNAAFQKRLYETDEMTWKRVRLYSLTFQCYDVSKDLSLSLSW